MLKKTIVILAGIWLCMYMTIDAIADDVGILQRNRSIVISAFDDCYPGISSEEKKHIIISHEGVYYRADYERVYIIDLQYEDIENITCTFHISNDGVIVYHSPIRLSDAIDSVLTSTITKQQTIEIALDYYNQMINLPSKSAEMTGFIRAYGSNSLDEDHLSIGFKYIWDDDSFEYPQWYVSLNYPFYGRLVTWLLLRIDSVSGECFVIDDNLFNDGPILFPSIN